MIPAEAYVGTMMQSLNIEVCKITCSESIVLYVILNWFQDILVVLAVTNHLETIKNNEICL